MDSRVAGSSSHGGPVLALPASIVAVRRVLYVPTADERLGKIQACEGALMLPEWVQLVIVAIVAVVLIGPYAWRAFGPDKPWDSYY